MTHWKNPFANSVAVPIEELAACIQGIGERCPSFDGTWVIYTVKLILEHWATMGPQLDAYILPQPSGFHNLGIRYGSESYAYLSPAGDLAKVNALLDKYTSVQGYNVWLADHARWTGHILARDANGMKSLTYEKARQLCTHLNRRELLGPYEVRRISSEIPTRVSMTTSGYNVWNVTKGRWTNVGYGKGPPQSPTNPEPLTLEQSKELCESLTRTSRHVFVVRPIGSDVDQPVVTSAVVSGPPVNDRQCSACGNEKCSSTEKSCWKCGVVLDAMEKP